MEERGWERLLNGSFGTGENALKLNSDIFLLLSALLKMTRFYALEVLKRILWYMI